MRQTNDRSFVSLDARTVRVWVWESIFTGAGIACAFLLVGAGLLVGFMERDFWWMIAAGVGCVWASGFALWGFAVFFWPRRSYLSWGYRVADEVIELRYGVVFRTSISIPMSRLQHVDLHRGPLLRRYGMASLELHTAGTRNASHTIPGLSLATAEEVRDGLIGVIHQGAKDRQKKESVDGT